MCNLQLLTQQENCKKAAGKRDYAFAAKNNKNRQCVKAIDQTTQEVVYVNGMYPIQQHLGINAGIVKMVCEGINNCHMETTKMWPKREYICRRCHKTMTNGGKYLHNKICQ